jgi:hypothetical protein
VKVSVVIPFRGMLAAPNALAIFTGPSTVRLMVVVWVSVPEVPVMVMALVPVVAVLLAVNVMVLLEVVGFGLMVAVTPLGSADLESVTAPAKPPEGVTVIVLLPFAPRTTVRLLGEAASVKSGGTLIVRLMVVVWVSVPEMPVMVMALVPVVAVLLAVNVIVLVEVVELGLIVAVTPLGSAEWESVTAPVKPPEGVTVMVLLPFAPARLSGCWAKPPA